MNSFVLVKGMIGQAIDSKHIRDVKQIYFENKSQKVQLKFEQTQIACYLNILLLQPKKHGYRLRIKDFVTGDEP